jgi:hypothetical protein
LTDGPAARATSTDMPAWHWWAAAIGAALVITMPLLVTDIPLLTDYPNHLARLYVITHIQSDPVLGRIYEVTWNVVPNLAMDLVVPPLSHLVPLQVAGRLFAAVALLLPVVGVIVLHRAAFGARSAAPLTAFLVAYNALFFWGFLNFVASMGLALLGVALWLREPARRGASNLLAIAGLALLLFVCHVGALALFGLTIGCVEFMRLLELRLKGELTAAIVGRRAVRIVVPFVIPAGLFLFAAPLGEGIATKPLLLQIKEYYWAVYNSWHISKLTDLGKPYAAYSPLLDGLAAAGTILLFAIQILRRGCRIAPGLLLAAAMLFAMYPVIPGVWLTAANLDWRLPIFAVLLTLAGIAPTGPAVRSTRLVAALLAVLLVARAGVVAYAWTGSNADIAEFRRVIRLVAPGERVLIVRGDNSASASSPIWRILYDYDPGSLAPLLTIDRRAFWPALFTSRTLQPVHVISPYRDIAVEQVVLPSYTDFLHPTARDLALNPYFVDWRSHFDYVLVLQPGRLKDNAPLLPHLLRRLDGAEICTLYAVER